MRTRANDEDDVSGRSPRSRSEERRTMTVLDDIPDTQLCLGRSTSLYSRGMETSMPVPSSGLKLQLRPDKISLFSLTICVHYQTISYITLGL